MMDWQPPTTTHRMQDIKTQALMRLTDAMTALRWAAQDCDFNPGDATTAAYKKALEAVAEANHNLMLIQMSAKYAKGGRMA